MYVQTQQTPFLNHAALAVAGGIGAFAALFAWLWSSHGADVYLGYLSGATLLCL